MPFENSNLRRLQENLRRVSGENRVRLFDMFNPAFMRKHTRYASFQALLDASGYKVVTDEDFKAIPDAEWEKHITRSTRFPSWLEMQKVAGAEWMQGQLFKGMR